MPREASASPPRVQLRYDLWMDPAVTAVPSVFDEVLRQRAAANERIVAIARFGFISFATLMDLLCYLGFLEFTTVVPTGMTLLLDLTFSLISATILAVVFRHPFLPAIKFVSITVEYICVGMMVALDPTVPKEGAAISWISVVAALFIFMYNLLHYSKAATLYAAGCSVLFFLTLSGTIKGGNVEGALPMLMGLMMMLGVGYRLTMANIEMMREANTKKMMERFLPPQLIGELYRQGTTLEPGGKNQEVTVLFSDIRSFTTMSEALPASEVVVLLNDYLSTMTDIIFAHQGTIDKFIGDAIMTVFGAPLRSDDDAERAIRTAIAMFQAVKTVSQRHVKLGQPLEIGVGIHTGDVIVGSIGSAKRLDYTVIGDNVNLSSRIEGLTKHYGCSILVSGSTLDKVYKHNPGAPFLVREVDTVYVKGKSKKITVYEVLCYLKSPGAEALSALKVSFEAALALYKSQRFPEAASLFRQLAPDGLSARYAARCQEYITNPPGPLWDGAFSMTEK